MSFLSTAMKADTRGKQEWMYLEDFPVIGGAEVGDVYNEALMRLGQYADEHLAQYQTSLRRAKA
jgi:hypothetical protein